MASLVLFKTAKEYFYSQVRKCDKLYRNESMISGSEFFPSKLYLFSAASENLQCHRKLIFEYASIRFFFVHSCTDIKLRNP